MYNHLVHINLATIRTNCTVNCMVSIILHPSRVMNSWQQKKSEYRLTDNWQLLFTVSSYDILSSFSALKCLFCYIFLDGDAC